MTFCGTLECNQRCSLLGPVAAKRSSDRPGETTAWGWRSVLIESAYVAPLISNGEACCAQPPHAAAGGALMGPLTFSQWSVGAGKRTERRVLQPHEWRRLRGYFMWNVCTRSRRTRGGSLGVLTAARALLLHHLQTETTAGCSQRPQNRSRFFRTSFLHEWG